MIGRRDPAVDPARIDAATDVGEDLEHAGRIDWSALEPVGPRRSQVVDLERKGSKPEDGSIDLGPGVGRRALDVGAPLDAALAHVEPADVYVDRFTPATAEQERVLEARFAEDPRPEHWIGAVNPRDGLEAVRTGRWENCCACARAFQDGLDGRPRVAAAIDPRGLSLDGTAGGPGEHSAFTEQWAGRRFERAAYADVAEHIERTGGSAILHVSALEGAGHAFNAFWDERLGRVRWADAQRGVVDDWPPTELERAFPLSSVMYFRGGRS